MGSFAAPTVLGTSRVDKLKMITFTVVGSASYATSGDTLDLSAHFPVRTDLVILRGVPTGGAADSKYRGTYVRAAAGASATGLVKFDDLIQATPAELANTTDLSAVTFIGVAYGE